ncbi:MAG: hypothetical protein ACR2PA_07045 [Hyphomicrobiaceae bacterium]
MILIALFDDPSHLLLRAAINNDDKADYWDFADARKKMSEAVFERKPKGQ